MAVSHRHLEVIAVIPDLKAFLADLATSEKKCGLAQPRHDSDTTVLD